MRERKFIKVKVNMYDDIKFKIIDRKPNRDLTHYVWNRIIVLAGKCNAEGALYMSRTTPYCIETLAIEFNREPEEVEGALKVLMELEMVEFTKEQAYRVTNFAKHQNIKVKEESDIKSSEIKVEEASKDEDSIKGEKKPCSQKSDENIIKGKVNNKDENTISLEVQKSKKKSKKKKAYEVIEFKDDGNDINEIDGLHDKERPLGVDERVKAQWAFG